MGRSDVARAAAPPDHDAPQAGLPCASRPRRRRSRMAQTCSRTSARADDRRVESFLGRHVGVVAGTPWALHGRPTQGRGAGGMTAPRRLAAILAADLVGI